MSEEKKNTGHSRRRANVQWLL